LGIQSTLTCLCLALRCISRQGGRTLDWARNMKIYGRARLQDEDEEDVPMMHIFHGSGHQPISSLRWRVYKTSDVHILYIFQTLYLTNLISVPTHPHVASQEKITAATVHLAGNTFASSFSRRRGLQGRSTFLCLRPPPRREREEGDLMGSR
jgi:hypothetical protein